MKKSIRSAGEADGLIGSVSYSGPLVGAERGKPRRIRRRSIRRGRAVLSASEPLHALASLAVLGRRGEVLPTDGGRLGRA